MAAALQKAGLRLGSALPATGVITGAVQDEKALRSIAALPGVAAVEQAQEVQLPPPDEPVQ